MASKRSIEKERKERKERNGSLDSQLTAYSGAAGAALRLDASRRKRPGRGLAAYSAAAAGVGLIPALNVDAAIVHYSTGWTVQNGFEFFDFDGGGYDFRLRHAASRGTIRDDTDGSVATDGGGKWAQRFDFGDTISGGAHTDWRAGYAALHHTWNVSGQFGPGQSGYVGVKFDSSGTTVYGWIHIDSVGTPWTNGYHVAAYGYQTDGSASHAGEQIPEPSTIALALLASGAAGVMASRRKKILKGRK